MGDAGRSEGARWHTAMLAAGLLTLAACSIIPAFTAMNEPTGSAPPRKTRANDEVKTADLPQGVFVGIALSGGGSRAANFSTAVLLELGELGLLDAATALSSVSGSSLPTAYYGLFGDDPRRWNRDQARDLMRTNFQSHWIARWFLPQYALAYWLTDFDRSDIMARVFDRFLFEKRTFADMGARGPRILINATSLSSSHGFTFTDRAFERSRPEFWCARTPAS